MWYVYLVTLLMCLAFLGVSIGKHKFSPVRVWTFVWAVSFVFHAIFGGVFYFSGEVVAVMAMGLGSYIIGAMVFWAGNPSTEPRNAAFTSRFGELLLRSRFVGYFTTAMILVLVVLIERGSLSFFGTSLASFFSGSIGELMRNMTDAKAALQLDESLFPIEFKIATLLIVVCSVFSFYGVSAERPARHSYLNAVFLMVVAFIFSAVTGVRSFILVPVIVGFFSYYTGCVMNGRAHVLVARKTLLWLFTTLISFSLWVVFVQSARLGDVNLSRVGQTLEHLRPWVAGYVPALSILMDEAGNYSPAWGRVFADGFLKQLGLGYGDIAAVGVEFAYIGNWQASNAMTVFRVFFLDFGYIGSIFFCFTLGWIGEFLYQRALTRSGAWVPLLIGTYCWTFFSINFWFFYYGSRVYGLIGCCLVFALLSRIIHHQLRREKSIIFSGVSRRRPIPSNRDT